MPHGHGPSGEGEGGGGGGARRFPSYLRGFDREKGGRFADLLGEEFIPELDLAKKRRSRVEEAFFGFLDPSAGERFVTEGAERIGTDVLRAGGPVTEAIRRARGQSIGSGFGTTGGDLSRSEANIVTEGLRSSVGSFIGQSLPGLYEGAGARATQAFGITQQQVSDRGESLFTGLGAAESLRLAQPKRGLFGLGLGPL